MSGTRKNYPHELGRCSRDAGPAADMDADTAPDDHCEFDQRRMACYGCCH